MANFPFATIDLTHTLHNHVPTWSGSDEFDHVLHKDHNPQDEYKFRKHMIHMHAGCGTHMDAPIHCMPGGKDISELTMDQLVTPCFVIDVSDKADATYVVSKDDILGFEDRYGRITERSFVIIRTGWNKHWSNSKKYRNNLTFPTISIEAAQILADRNIAGLGVDTLSPDGPEEFPIHNLFLQSGKYLVENLANIDALPPTGSFTAIMPLKIKDGTESPIRAIALVPKG